MTIKLSLEVIKINITQAKDILISQGEDPQTIDWASYSKDIELQDWLNNEYGIKLQSETAMFAQDKCEQEKFSIIQEKQITEEDKKKTQLKDGLDFAKLIPKLKNVFVTGDLGSGKTAFSYFLLESLKKYMPIYVFKHPDKMLISKLGFKNLYSIDEIEGLNKIALFIDEPQLIFPKYEKRGSIILNKLLSLSRQKDIILVLSTSDTRYITCAEEFYISTYIIKKIDYQMIKRGSKAKNIIEGVATLTPEGFADKIMQNEFLFYNRDTQDLNGLHEFEMPKYFDEKLSKPYGFPKVIS